MPESLGDLKIMIRQLRQELEWAGRTGFVPPPISTSPQPPAPIPDAPPPPERAPERREEEPPPSQPDDSRPVRTPTETRKPRLQVIQNLLRKCEDLQEVEEVLGFCTRCKLSGQGRTKVVFGVGAENADIMFIGEGPGADEDRQGEPFVGKAGQLLTKMIEGGMGLRRSDVYIANIVKCRPPRNRDPEPDEVETCRPFVEAQVRLIQPKVIITLGRYASQTLLNTGDGMKKMRGKWRDYDGVAVMPTFHPAYLLRNPEGKRPVWEDIQEVLKFLGMPVPTRGR